MARYFVLAKGTKILPHAGNHPWPYEVSLCFDPVAHPIGFAEGVGHGAVGGLFTAQEALQQQWREHFSFAQAEWLLPFIEQLAAVQSLNPSELITLAASRLGHAPESYEHQGA